MKRARYRNIRFIEGVVFLFFLTANSEDSSEITRIHPQLLEVSLVAYMNVVNTIFM